MRGQSQKEFKYKVSIKRALFRESWPWVLGREMCPVGHSGPRGRAPGGSIRSGNRGWGNSSQSAHFVDQRCGLHHSSIFVEMSFPR